MKKILLVVLVSLSMAQETPKKLYSKCIKCHGKYAAKRVFGEDIIISKLTKGEIIKDLKAYKSEHRNKYGLGNVMSAQVKHLNNVDIKELAVYISNLARTNK